MTIGDTFYRAYLEEFRERLQSSSLAKQPDANQVQAIALEDERYLRGLVDKLEITEADLPSTPVALRIHNPLERLGKGLENTANRNKKEVCIIGTMAVAAAILAAWVASGGTLAIGSVVAGVTISGPLYAALVGGASGAVIAEILCS